MGYRLHYLPLSLGLALALSGSINGIAAQSCTLEYRRADNMWANWGRPDGFLGAETITLQPGQTKVFATDWSYEKQRNDGTNYYGSHLRHAVNRGATPVYLRLRGPGQYIVKRARPVSATGAVVPGMGSILGAILKAFTPITGTKASLPTLEPGDTSFHRHDLAEVTCPAAAVATAPPPEPPPPPTVASLTGTPATATTTTISVTVEVHDAKSGVPLTGQVTINGVTGATGQALTYSRCSETIEYEDARGVSRTRTIRVPCEGTVKINGYPDTFFTF